MLEIKFANAGDVDCIVRLIRKSFDDTLLSAMLYGCSGINNYIKDQLSTPYSMADTKYIVAKEKGSISGCAEIRLFGDTIFLNYICTSQGDRTRGLGNKILFESISRVRQKVHARMSLDVFLDNNVAKNWYQNLGFSSEYLSNWWRMPLISGKHPSGCVSGYPQAMKCYSEYGFSQFTLTTESGTYAIGVLGSDWFRISDPMLLQDESALDSLAGMGSRRMLLGLFRDDDTMKVPDSATKFCTSVRMSMDLDELSRALAERVVN